MDGVALAAGGWTATLWPALGGSLASLRHDGVDIFRPAVPGTVSPLETACFPLVPYANRIADGRFAFDGIEHRLPLNFGDHPHSLHGLGWQRPWQVIERDAASATLAHEHDGGAGWPWPYRAIQRIALDDGLRLALELINLGDRAMPAGLGFHPYFPVDEATSLHFAARHVWLSDPTMLPTEAAPSDAFGDFSAGEAVRRRPFIDNSYDGWAGTARIHQRDATLVLRATGSSVAHLYVPFVDTSFFCFEPVSHLPDAANRPEPPMPVLAPGETLRIAFALSIEN